MNFVWQIILSFCFVLHKKIEIHTHQHDKIWRDRFQGWHQAMKGVQNHHCAYLHVHKIILSFDFYDCTELFDYSSIEIINFNYVILNDYTELCLYLI